ncbi:MAG TPA: crossover junction endodeoxyribonuclease RuvC [Synergistales bacterium]|nr:crossover junction endodeoxyribonuclease RuvC [Synergistales bacterium]
MNSRIDERKISCLGIDPGLGRMGYGLVCINTHQYRVIGFGCIETPPKTDVALRIHTIYDSLRTHIEQWKPDILSVEKLFFGRNITTAENVWQARGTVLLLAAQYGIPYYEPKPTQVKNAICGTGNAGKIQIQRMLQRLLDLSDIPRPDDAADALAIAITGLALHSFETRRKGYAQNS